MNMQVLNAGRDASGGYSVDVTRGERLALVLPAADAPVETTLWSFGQLAAQIGAPAAYLRQLPAALAGINLQYSLIAPRAEQIKIVSGLRSLPGCWLPKFPTRQGWVSGISRHRGRIGSSLAGVRSLWAPVAA